MAPATARMGAIASGDNEMTTPITFAIAVFMANTAQCVDVPRVVSIDAGTFIMGPPTRVKRNGEYHADESQLQVSVPGFSIGESPITASQFCQFLNSEAARDHDASELYWTGKIGPFMYSTIVEDNGTYMPSPGAGNAPANQVTWKGAVMYCRWLSELTRSTYRLPSEAEWEFAARGPEGRYWPWGSESPTASRGYRKIADWDNRWQQIERTPVGTFPAGATPDGVMDLLGYVIGEWCANKYVKHATKEQLLDAATDLTDLDSDRVVRGCYDREYEQVGIPPLGWILHHTRGDTHPGRLWTRQHGHPIAAPRCAARYGFRVVKEVH